MRQKLVKLFSLLLAVPFLVAFVPYAHDGTLAVVVDGEVVRARAVFSTEAASSDSEVLVRSVFALPGGGEGTLAMVIRLVPVGSEAPVKFTYYEKANAKDVVFQSDQARGRVVVGDRLEYGGETSLYLEFDATFTQGEVTRHLESGWAVTAPSPAILRSTGRLPDGVVIIDDGSGAFTGRAYDRGSVDCYGYPEEVVLVETYHDDFVVVDNGGSSGQVILDPPDDGLDGIDEPGGGTDDYQIIYDPADNGGYTTDSDGPGCFTDDDSTTSGGDEPAGCGGSGSESSSDDASSSGCGSSKSSSDSGCVGDAEAARGQAHYVRFGPRVAHRPAWARRVLRVSPLLLALAALLVVPRRRGLS